MTVARHVTAPVRLLLALGVLSALASLAPVQAALYDEVRGITRASVAAKDDAETSDLVMRRPNGTTLGAPPARDVRIQSGAREPLPRGARSARTWSEHVRGADPPVANDCRPRSIAWNACGSTNRSATAGARPARGIDGDVPVGTAGTIASGPVDTEARPVIIPGDFLDVVYGGDAGAANMDGIYNVLADRGYLWVGHGSSNSRTAAKAVAVRLSDGAVGAFDRDGRFFVPRTPGDRPTAGYFEMLSENVIVYRAPDGVAFVHGDTQGEAAKYSRVIPGRSAQKISTIGADGHYRAAISAGDRVLHQVDGRASGTYPNFKISEDRGRTWRDPVTRLDNPDGSTFSRTTLFEQGGVVYIFEEWRPGDTGSRAEEPAIMRFDPGAPEEFAVLWDDHAALAPWTHYSMRDTIEVGGRPYPVTQDVYPGVDQLIAADDRFYYVFENRVGATRDPAEPPTAIPHPARSVDAAGRPTEAIAYFGWENRLYAYAWKQETLFVYDPSAQVWSDVHRFALGFAPHRYDLDPKTGTVVFGTAGAEAEQVAYVEGLFRRVEKGESLPVTFRVNMAHQVETGGFLPQSESVDVAGTFNEWGRDAPTVLSDPDEDLVYETTVDGFAAGQLVAYTYRIDGVWDDRAEFDGAGSKRRFRVRPGRNIVSVWYDDEEPAGAAVRAGFEAANATAVEGGLVFFQDRSTGAVEAWNWTFEGGRPAASVERDPAVRYDAPGTYDVTLRVRGAGGQDTLMLADYVHVRDRDVDAVSWWNHTVFYGLFVRSFYDSDGDGIGDLNGVIEKLDYLNDGDPRTDRDLGVTGLWLMPIYDSPSYHGYDVTGYQSVDPDYGTLADVRRLLEEAHQRGIRVTLDFVMNHSSRQHPWFQQSAKQDSFYRDFYRWWPGSPGEQGPGPHEAWHRDRSGHYYGHFGRSMPDLNYANPSVRDSMLAAARFWLEEVGVDGLRLHAANSLFASGEASGSAEASYRFWAGFSDDVKAGQPDAFGLCDARERTPVAARYVIDGRLDACLEYGLAAALLGALRSGDARTLRAQMERVYRDYPHLLYGTFLAGHDQDRVMSVLSGDERRARVAAALYLTLPGIPHLYYGEEIGQAGAGSTETLRRPMRWTDEPGAGFTTGEPWTQLAVDDTTRHVAAQQADSTSLLSWYRTLIGLRHRETALRLGTYASVDVSVPSVMAFLREHEGSPILVLVNTAPEAADDLALDLPAGAAGPGAYALVDLISGDSVATHVDAGLHLAGRALPGLQVRIYRLVRTGEATATDEQERVPAGLVLGQNYPNPTDGRTTVPFILPAPGRVRLEVYDVLGRRITTLLNASLPAGRHAPSFEVGELPAGAYLYRLDHADGRATRRMMVK